MGKILVVDDCNTTRKLLAKTLAGIDLDVTAASDGAEVLSLAKEEKFDLIVTDVNMPDVGGIELTTESRNLAGYKVTPILMLTSDSSQSEKEKGLGCGRHRMAGEAV
jgi:two-component system chemotaxis response regulator CheY